MPSAVQHNCPCSPLLLLLHESLSLDARVHVCFYKGDSIMIVRGSWHSAVCQDAVTEAMRGACPGAQRLQLIPVKSHYTYSVSRVR